MNLPRLTILGANPLVAPMAGFPKDSEYPSHESRSETKSEFDANSKKESGSESESQSKVRDAIFFCNKKM